jgi:hypothetical protein
MKKSKSIQLVLITAVVASCNTKKDDWESGNKTYVRSDTTAQYTRTHHYGSGLMFWAFRPFYSGATGIFGRSGYYSGAMSDRSNFGSNRAKSSSYRGGFGRSGRFGS